MFVCCESGDKTIESKSPDKVFVDLAQKITDLNAEYKIDELQTRSAAVEVFIVVVAFDALGGFYRDNSNIFGFSWSWKRAGNSSLRLASWLSSDEYLINNDDNPLVMGVNYDLISSQIGIYGNKHNEVIKSVHKKYAARIPDLTYIEIASLFDREARLLFGGSDDSLTAVDSADEVEAELNIYKNAENFDDYIEMMKFKNISYAHFYNPICVAVEGLVLTKSSLIERQQYIDDLNEIIEQSNLSHTEKNAILSSVSVAEGSSNLWIID